MLTNDERLVLEVAVKLGWFSVTRDYNAQWPNDMNSVKNLEVAGLLKFESLERNPLTKQLTRKSTLTENGTLALKEAKT